MTVNVYDPIAFDNDMDEAAPTTNYGTQTIMVLGCNGKGIDARRLLLEVDVSDIPAGSTVATAVLAMVINASHGSAARASTAYRLKRAWTETGSTWNKYDGTNDWGTAGATHADDIDTGVTDTFTAGTSGTDSISVVNIVQDAINNRSGIVRIMMKYDNDQTQAGTPTGTVYKTTEHATTTDRPKLTVDFTPPAAATKRATAHVFD